ncbi:MAG: hypothetical protein ACHQ49_18265, partial [Elusimicrobiota bacterium]
PIPTAPAAAAAAAPSGDAPAPRSVNVFWSGLEIGEYAGSASFTEDNSAPWLDFQDQKLSAAFNAALGLASRTPAGRRALDAAKAVFARDGRTLSVDVLDLHREGVESGDSAAAIRLDPREFSPGREAELAGTIAHQLLRLARHSAGLPSKSSQASFTRQTSAALRRASKNSPAPDAGAAPARETTEAPWLALADKKYAAALDAAIRIARGTNAGRRAFDAAQKALAAQGRTLPVDVLDLGRNYGEYDYVGGRLRLGLKMFEPGREAELAGTIAHELVHVAQHAAGLPSNALELEIEAHLQDLELLAELGVKPPKHTFARQSYDALRAGPKKFIELIEAAVPGAPFLGDSDFEDIEELMEQELESTEKRRGAKAAALAKVVEADLDLIRSPEGRKKYQEFSRRVLALLEAASAAAKN